MKLVTRLLILTCLVFPFQPANAKTQPKNVVVLTSSMVDSADDIEAAIITITDHGTHPGTVILDGQFGPFEFVGDDRSLNIFVSNLTLRGINQSIIDNCDDGLFFDDFPLQQILIDGITFLCTGDGVEATGTFKDVTLRDNYISAGNNGIGATGHSSGWLIANNYIQAGGDGIRIAGGEDISITDNYLFGNIGVALLRASQFRIQHNIIRAANQGVLIGQESWENAVQGNLIYGVNLAGIALEPGVVDNRILANRVRCAPDSNCVTIDALQNVVESNKLAGNKP